MTIKFFILCLSAIFYGLLIAYIVPYWSFDYDALVSSAIYYRTNGPGSFLGLLGNNVVLLYIWDYTFGFLTPTVSVAFLYGFAAAVRLLVLFSLFRFRFCLPLFLATAVFNDLNVCRYSLTLSFMLLTLDRLGPVKASVIFFPLHIFMPATIFMLSVWSRYWRVAIVAVIFLMIIILPEVFTRHFNVIDGELFPRIAYVYIMLACIVLLAFRKELSKNIFNFKALIIGLTLFNFAEVPFGNAYYFRFSNLAFESSLLLVAWHHARLEHVSTTKPFSLKFGIYIAVCFLAGVYSFILIGGNIWRFF